MRTISNSECSSFDDVRKLFERVFGEVDEINFVIAPEKVKRLAEIAKAKAVIEKKAKADADAKIEANVRAKEIADAQLVIDNAVALEKNKLKTESDRSEALKKAKKVIADSKKKGDK